KDSNSWAPGAFITVTKVRVTPALAIVRIYLSFLNTQTAKAELKQIQNRTSENRYKLGTKIKNQVRVVPELEFFLDDTNEYVERMEKLFEKISKEPRQPD